MKQQSFWLTLVFSLGYLGLALACLFTWDASNPWGHLDRYSGGYLILRLVASLHSLISSRKVFRSKQVMQEWWALDSDPAGPTWVMVLMVSDLLVFLAYGRWHPLRVLEHPVLQGLGLGLYSVVIVWQAWTDGYLANYFERQESLPLPMNRGPFRFIRHPRYAAAMLGKVALALAFASAIAWFLAAAWMYLLIRKISIEEAHLRTVFGPTYEAYSRKTARVFPGIY